MTYQKILQFAREMRKNPTPAERFFWEKVRNRRFLGKKFNRQFIIQQEEIAGQRRFFIADFHCHEWKLIVELDGKIHLQQMDYDQIREARLIEMGFRVIRFNNEEVLENWEMVAERLAGC
ncbi:MAG: endonuclease domain-containing protein [Bacteroidota bacterium]